MDVFGRRIIATTLDPIPRLFRAAPGVLAMNQSEIDAFTRGDREVFHLIVDICKAEDRVDALLAMQIFRPRRRRLSPSTRLFMLGAVSPGRSETIRKQRA
jgi:hypothetical protein